MADDMPNGALLWISLDSDGVREILNSPEVSDLVTAAAENAAATARANAHMKKYAEELRVETRRTRPGSRTIADVIAPWGAGIEAEKGILAKALGSAIV